VRLEILSPGEPSDAESDAGAHPDRGAPAEPLPDYADHPLVKRTLELFDARIVQVRPKPGAAGAPPAPPSPSAEASAETD